MHHQFWLQYNWSLEHYYVLIPDSSEIFRRYCSLDRVNSFPDIQLFPSSFQTFWDRFTRTNYNLDSSYPNIFPLSQFSWKVLVHTSFFAFFNYPTVVAGKTKLTDFSDITRYCLLGRSIFILYLKIADNFIRLILQDSSLGIYLSVVWTNLHFLHNS